MSTNQLRKDAEKLIEIVVGGVMMGGATLTLLGMIYLLGA